MQLQANYAMKVPWCLVLFCWTLAASFRAASTDLSVVPLDQDLSNLNQCPKLYSKVFEGFVPIGKLEDVHYNKSTTANSFNDCVLECCSEPSCLVTFIVSNSSTLTCYKTHCDNEASCLPTKPDSALPKGTQTAVVLVRPSSESWHQVFEHRPCEYGLDQCLVNEVCVAKPKSRNGLCQCESGLERNSDKLCEKSKKAKLMVQVSSKNITLPADSATLTAYAIPEATKDEPYVYEWTLLSSQSDDGTMENRNGQVLKLSKLKEGIYEFKVNVKGRNAEGEGTGYVRVVRTRVNTAPKAIAVPSHQNITLPTKKAIVDGSQSKDDADDQKTLQFKWILEEFPMAYKEKFDDEGATLALDNLIAGKYRLKLTVTDSDGAKDSTLADLDVFEETDYKPIANAGEDVMVFLPKNSIDLHGNGSSDDHGIVSWEWTRLGENVKLPADMTDSRKPVLHLSNLEEGSYEFKLTVTDAKGQHDADTVNVYVKPPSNLPPKADAGSELEISLPKNWVTLDGSKSSDDVGVTSYAWSQVEGPNKANILKAETAAANATGLTKGQYKFKLTVGDDAGNVDSAEVSVVVKQDNNAAPVAVAGDDMVVTLPLSVVMVNGSGSTDDLRIARWQWTRLPNSLAAGKIIGNSSQEPVLLLTDLVPGQYLFSLKVWDDQGKSNTDQISINVHENPHHLDEVEAVINEQLSALTTSRLNHLSQSLSLLLSEGETDTRVYHINVLKVYSQPRTGNVVIQFDVRKETKEGKKTVMKGTEVVDKLNQKLVVGQGVLQLQVLELETLVCQNDCSGHGSCQQSTRECICEPFWIENFVRRRLMDGKQNCEWSVIYVGIIFTIIVTGTICLCIYMKCRKRGPSRFGNRFKSAASRTKRRYTRLEQTEPGLELRNAHTSSLMMSESDSESDEPLFDDELRKKRRPLRKNGTPTSSDNGVINPPQLAIRRANGTLKTRDNDERA